MNIDAKRHKLLELLSKQRKDVELKKATYNVLGVTFEKIYEELKIDSDELYSITSDLYSSEEIAYHNAHDIVGLFAKDKGVTSFVNEKYKKRIYDRRIERIKLVLPILAVGISLASLYVSKINNIGRSKFDIETKEIQAQIDTLMFQINLLKGESYNYSVKNNDSLN